MNKPPGFKIAITGQDISEEITGNLIPQVMIAARRHYYYEFIGPSHSYDEASFCKSRYWMNSLDEYACGGQTKRGWSKPRYTTSGLFITLELNKFFPYNNGNNEPIYNEENGAQLRDPVTGL